MIIFESTGFPSLEITKHLAHIIQYGCIFLLIFLFNLFFWLSSVLNLIIDEENVASVV
jgi:hypothetical protein